MVEHLVANEDVAGSSPATCSTRFISQLLLVVFVIQRIENNVNRTETWTSWSFFVSGESMIYAIVILSVAVLVALGLLAFQSIILSYIEKTSPTDTLMNEPLGSVYAERWILWPKIDTRKGTWNHKHKFALIVNKFYGPDLDPHHNHMGYSASLVLDGMGYEEIYGKNNEITLWPFTFRFRSRNLKHKIHSYTWAPLTTFFVIRLDPDANWGFWENGVFTEARKFKGTKTFKH